MQVIVLGASGYLGQYVCAELRRRNIPLYAAGEEHERVDLRYHDCGDVLHSNCPNATAIVNCAALADVDECERSPLLAYMINAAAVGYLADNPKLPRMVHVSTDHVYNGKPRIGKEAHSRSSESDVDLVNSYARTKFVGDISAIASSKNNAVFRTNFFGPSTVNKQSLSDYFMQSFAVNKATVNAFTDSWFNPLHVATLASLLVDEAVSDRPLSGVYNVGSRGALSKYEFAVIVKRLLYPDSISEVVPTSMPTEGRARRPSNMLMDCSSYACVYPNKLPSLSEEIRKLALSA